MKINENTITALKNFASINPSILIKAGSVLETVSPSKTIIGKIQITEEFPQKFGIYDLSQFLGVISLFNDPDIEFFESYLSVSEKGEVVNYRYGDEKLIQVPPAKGINFPTPDVSFTLTAEALAKIQKAGSVLGMPEIAVVGEDGKITVRALNSKESDSNNYRFEVGETDLTFRAVFKTENIKVIPDDYTVDITSQGMARFVSGRAEYLVAIERASSKF